MHFLLITFHRFITFLDSVRGGGEKQHGGGAGGADSCFGRDTWLFVRGVNLHSLLVNSQLALVQLVVDTSEERTDNSDDGVEGA